MERTLITVPNAIPMVAVVGPHDANLRTIEAAFPSVNITVRGNEITLRGPHDDCAKLENLFNELMVVIRSGNILNVDAVSRAIEMLEHKPADHPAEVMSLNIVSNRGRTIRPKTANQKRYVDAIEDHTITFGIGPADINLRALERAFPALEITVRGSEVQARGAGKDVAAFEKLLEQLVLLVERGQEVTPQGLEQSLKMLRGNSLPGEVLSLNILNTRGRTIRPKTLNQKHYVDAIDKNTIVFGIGPAGSGKTYLAVAKAVQALQSKQVSRIILTRPAVEAGERLGFLPGTLHEKIDPYLRPLFDALHDMMDPDSIPKLVANGTIEIAPLAYMRGRTLNDSFIILDEAQNTSPEQMKMFLTRLGFGSKMVITGDVTQVDLPSGIKSGLKVVRDILDGVVDLDFIELTSEDVVRHKIVADIVEAYQRFDEQNSTARPRPLHKDR